MDLVAGAKKIVVLMEHCSKSGEAKILNQCSLPLTGLGVVSRIITDLGVFDITPEGINVVELADQVEFEEVQQKTGAPLINQQHYLQSA